MYPYKTWGLSASAAASNDIWVKAIVYQYVNDLHTTTDSKIATATHELGHCLSIKHPDSVWDAPDAIMVPGLHTTYTLDPEYDVKQLRLKWGS